MKNVNIGFAMTGSFCTFSKALKVMESFVLSGANVIPIMSFNARNTDTRFGKAEDFATRIREITGNEIIDSLVKAEPVGPENMTDLMIVLPCSGNTLSKLANGIYDTPVTLAVKSHLRNQRPVLVGVSTNDALANSAKSIGQLLNYKNYYFVPMSQDDPVKKPFSVVCDFDKTFKAAEYALRGMQMQSVIF